MQIRPFYGSPGILKLSTLLLCLIIPNSLFGQAVAGTFDFSTVTGAGTTTLTQTVSGVTVTVTSDFGTAINTDAGVTGNAIKCSQTFEFDWRLRFSHPVTVTAVQLIEYANNSSGSNYEFIPSTGTKISVADNDATLADFFQDYSPADWVGISEIRVSYDRALTNNNHFILGIDQIVFTADLSDNVPPYATVVSQSGVTQVDQTLQGIYTYADANSDTESGTTYQWYRQDDFSGTSKVAIAGATSKTYKVVSGDVGKYLSFEVKPRDGTAFGIAEESPVFGPVFSGTMVSGTFSFNFNEGIIRHSSNAVQQDVSGIRVTGSLTTGGNPRIGTTGVVFSGTTPAVSGNELQGNIKYDQSIIVTFDREITVTSLSFGELTDNNSGDTYSWTAENSSGQVGTVIQLNDNDAVLSDLAQKLEPTDWVGITKITLSYDKPVSPTTNWIPMFDQIEFSATVIPPTAAPTSATVAATVFLEGAYNGTNMNTALNASIPTTQPYSINGHSGGTAGSIPANAVDWVLVELREAGSAGAALNSTRKGSAAGFLMNDGTIKATDGTSNLTVSLSGNSGANFFVVIYHRNHLPIMSASAISESSGTYTIDFTSNSANTHQTTTALASLSGGKFGMPSGDADGDGDVDASDLTSWRGQNGGGFTYNTTNADFNLDGVINAIDRNLFWKGNNSASKTRQVPST